MKHYDDLMIGFGKGAKTLAGSLAAEGRRVAVVEQSEKMYGGTCINVGCIPTKSLVNSAKAASLQNSVSFGEKSDRYAAAVSEKNRVTSMLRKKNFGKLDASPNVDVITGKASFVSPHELKIVPGIGELRISGEPAGATEIRISADRIFINTGSAAVMPSIEGIGGPHVYTSETLLDLEVLPERLVIVGGGYIGLEFASYFANFGSEVTVLVNTADFILREDREIAEEIRKVMTAKGVRFVFNANVRKISEVGGCADCGSASLSAVEGTISSDGREESFAYLADAVLIATGRRPNTSELNLEAAGVETLANGAVKVDSAMKTTAPGIWAMGDVKGGQQFTYISLDDYRIVRSQLNGGSRTSENRGEVPYSVFIDPPFSRVGLTAAEASAKGFEIAEAKLPAAAIPKAQVLRETDGLLKAVVDRRTGRILGASLFCAESHEMINLLKLAMDAGLTYEVVRDQIFTHPTMSEALNDLFSGVKV